MNYKEILRNLKEKEKWEELLSSSLKLFDENKDKYTLRMIVHAYEHLDNEKDAVPFWQILAKGENEPEKYSRKLIEYFKKTGDKKNQGKWSRKLIFQALKKKDFDTVEDIWIQLVDAENIRIDFALTVAHKLESLEENERAFTLLDIYLLSIENIEPLPQNAIDISKNMLNIDADCLEVRKRLGDYYRRIYKDCTEIDNFLDKVDIRRTKNVKNAIGMLEKLLNFCPGKYVMHKSWGIGKIRSIDILFGKIFVGFQSYPEHPIDLDLAFSILSPLSDDDFNVLKIENRDFLISLKNENPSQLIKLILKQETSISQDRLKTLLSGIVNNKDWTGFIERLKKTLKTQGVKLERKGKHYVFEPLLLKIVDTKTSLDEIESMAHTQDKIDMLLSIMEEKLGSKEMQKWKSLAQKILNDENIDAKTKINLIFAQYELTGDKNEIVKTLDFMLKNTQITDLEILMNKLPKRVYKKEFLQFVSNKNYRFIEKMFLETTDDWLRGYCEKILEKQGKIENLRLKVLEIPNKYPLCFLYLLEKIIKSKEKNKPGVKPIIFFEILLELIVNKDAKQKARAKSVFSRYCFDIYRWVLDTASKEEIEIVLDIIKKSEYIDSEDKKAFERLAEIKHPVLMQKPSRDFFYSTKEALKKKKQEFDRLVKVEIPANSEAIGKAARQGDLSENFDYISAKEKQKRLTYRINMLRNELAKARPIEEASYIDGQVGIGTEILALDLESGKRREILILGPWDRHPTKEIISHTAPLASELLGKKIGDTFFDKYHKKTYRIVKVQKHSNDI